jgi:hypothetical protein
LELGGYSNIWKDGNDHQSTDAVPDFVIFRGDKWNPKEGALRANIVVDIKIKQRFNPISLIPEKNIKLHFPGDAGEAYTQALKRAAAAFRVDSKLNYFVVVTDMEHIIFWKLVPTKEMSIEAYGAGPHLFGGTYSGKMIIIRLIGCTEDLTLSFPGVDKIPDEFEYFFSLISWRLKASAEAITIV